MNPTIDSGSLLHLTVLVILTVVTHTHTLRLSTAVKYMDLPNLGLSASRTVPSLGYVVIATTTNNFLHVTLRP